MEMPMRSFNRAFDCFFRLVSISSLNLGVWLSRLSTLIIDMAKRIRLAKFFVSSSMVTELCEKKL